MGNIIGNIMGNMCSIVEGNNDSTPTPATTKKHGKSGKSGIFTKYEQSDLIRLLYSYVIFGVIAFTLVKVQLDPTKRYPHVLMMSIIYVVLTFLVEILWLYFFSSKYRTKKGQKFSSRNTVYKILNNVLPIAALIFGYVILIDGFRSGNSNNTEFILRFLVSIVFIVSYGYLFYNLVNTLNTKTVKTALKDAPKGNPKKDNFVSKYDYIIDLLYNLFQPISILIVSIVIYYTIKITRNIGGSVQVTNSVYQAPAVPAPAAPVGPTGYE